VGPLDAFVALGQFAAADRAVALVPGSSDEFSGLIPQSGGLGAVFAEGVGFGRRAAKAAALGIAVDQWRRAAAEFGQQAARREVGARLLAAGVVGMRERLDPAIRVEGTKQPHPGAVAMKTFLQQIAVGAEIARPAVGIAAGVDRAFAASAVALEKTFHTDERAVADLLLARQPAAVAFAAADQAGQARRGAAVVQIHRFALEIAVLQLRLREAGEQAAQRARGQVKGASPGRVGRGRHSSIHRSGSSPKDSARGGYTGSLSSPLSAAMVQLVVSPAFVARARTDRPMSFCLPERSA
jgi:hypothetical protein